jgi:putative hydrolase of the HAD superfamily
MTIQAVFLDAAGTLMRPQRGVGETYAAFAENYGMRVSAQDITSRFRTCFGAAPPLAFPGASADTIAALERDWWRTLVAQVFEPWGHFDRFDYFFADLFAYFARAEAWQLYPEVLQTLTALNARGLRLCVISNFDSRLLKILCGLGIAAAFDAILVSSSIGYAKPEPEIFHAALKRFNLSPAEALHVGDSEINDRQGAHNAGLRGVLVDREAPSRRDADHISSLSALVDLLPNPADDIVASARSA